MIASRFVAAALAGLIATGAWAQTVPVHPGLERIRAETSEARAEWNRRISGLVRTGALKLREERRGAGTSRDQWFVQMHKGVPVEGTEVWRQLDDGEVAGVDGTIYTDIDLNPVPKLTRSEAQAALQAMAPDRLISSRPPELIVLPTDGKYVLAYKARLFLGDALVTYYLDANSGQVVRSEPAAGPPGESGGRR